MSTRIPFASSALLGLLLIVGCGVSQTTTQVGPAGPQGPAGPAGIIFLNAYSPTTTYVYSDVVTYQGSAYFALLTNINVTPGVLTNPLSVADWAVLAAAGAAGATGAAGPAGPTGAQGPQGVSGVQGATGATGPTGQAGPIGPAGPAGIAFLNAYSPTVSYLVTDVVIYQGSSYIALQPSLNVTPGNAANAASVSDWAVLAAAGATGSIGLTGPSGAAGPQGIPGVPGPAGSAGATGPAGVAGPAGPVGPTGVAGPQGALGPAGATGSAGLAGPAGPAGPAGILFSNAYNSASSYTATDVVTYQGSSYFALQPSINVVPGSLTDPASTTDWALLAAGGAVGPAGAQGPQGVAGVAGPTGLTGSVGPAGATGPAGPSGPIGPQGAAGAAGAAGSVGPAGPQGPSGATGAAGALGPAGPSGATGATGAAGATGAVGPAGPTGPAGAAGAIGPAGPQGATGATGSTGAMGADGATGPTGPTGPAGPAGPAGPQGIQGNPGTLAGSYLSGLNFGVQGDSISAQFNNAWQTIVAQRTGMNFVMQDARGGRRFDQAFECWGQPAVGGTPGAWTSGYVFPGFSPNSCSNSQFMGVGTGTSFAQSVANLDVLFIELGTNDNAPSSNIPIGNPGDSTTAGTFYGNMRWVVETYENANPTMRIVLVTVQYNGFAASPASAQAYAEATETYGNSVGVPVINMFKKGGVNALTQSSLLLDTVHPNTTGFSNFYGPVIAEGVLQLR